MSSHQENALVFARCFQNWVSPSYWTLPKLASHLISTFQKLDSYPRNNICEMSLSINVLKPISMGFKGIIIQKYHYLPHSDWFSSDICPPLCDIYFRKINLSVIFT
jgi:hypothetical protein